MNIRETAAPKIAESAQETEKLQTLSETVGNEKFESTTAADKKLLQRLDGQKEMPPQINADAEINSGKSIDYGMMYCSDRCIKSRVNSGRCFHS